MIVKGQAIACALYHFLCVLLSWIQECSSTPGCLFQCSTTSKWGNFSWCLTKAFRTWICGHFCLTSTAEKCLALSSLLLIFYVVVGSSLVPLWLPFCWSRQERPAPSASAHMCPSSLNSFVLDLHCLLPISFELAGAWDTKLSMLLQMWPHQCPVDET